MKYKIEVKNKETKEWEDLEVQGADGPVNHDSRRRFLRSVFGDDKRRKLVKKKQWRCKNG